MKKNKYILIVLFTAFISLVRSEVNYALDISNNGYVNIGNLSSSINNSSQFSVAFWFKVNNDQEMRISDRAACNNGSNSNGCHRGFEFLIGAWGVSFRLMDTWENNLLIVRETSSFGDNNWHHIAATYNGNSDQSGVKIYIDGNLYETTTQFNSLTGSSVNELPLRIGGNGEDSGGAGLVDEVSIWLSVLNQQTVQDIMNFGLSGDEESLLSYWNFNEGTGETAYDQNLNNSYHGTVVNSTWTTDSAPISDMIVGCVDTYANNYNPNANVDDGSCNYPESGDFSLQFDGVDDFVGFGTSPDIQFNDNFSITSWFKINSFDNDLGAIISKVTPDQVSAIGIEKTLGQNKISFWIGDGSNWNEIRTPELQTGLWYFLAATNDGSTSRLYLNGDLVSSGPSLSPNNPTGNLRIGVHSFINEDRRFWNGLIDNVSIWDRLLSEEDILNIYSSDFSNNQNGLVAYWTFNENDGGLIFDRSGNQNHGTIYGPVWSEDVYVPPIPPVIGGNNSLIFDGVDDYVDTGLHGGDLTNGFSYAIDFKVVGNDQGALITKYNHPVMGGIVNAISLQVNPDGNLYNMVRTESGSIEFASDLFVRDGEWHSVQYTFDNYQDKISIWLDGNLHEYPVDNLEGSIYDESKTFWIGKHTHPQYPTYFKGLIDNVKIWSSPKYDFSSNNDLMLHYSFDDGQGSTVTDFGLYGGSGTIYGATWTGDASNPGCTDPYANNFSSDANVDDGSCLGYPDNGQYALNFDGQDDWIGGFDNELLRISDDITIEFDVLIPESASNDNAEVEIIMSYEGDGENPETNALYSIAVLNDGTLRWQHEYNNGQNVIFNSNIFIRDNKMHNVIVSRNVEDKTIKFYDNDILINTFSYDNDANGGEDAIFKFSYDQTAYDFSGIISQSKIYNTSYNGFENDETSLIAHWKFNAGQGNILYDHSGNQNHGTIYGGETWQQIINGCTDSYASNYNVDANVDDGSCNYPESGDFSLQFDGVDDYIRMDAPQLDNIFKGYNPFTISTWLKRSNEQSVNDHLNVFSKGTTPNSEGTNPRGVMILTHVSGDITFILYSAPYDFIYVSANNFLTTDSWDHISATYDGGTSPESLKLYKNGSLHENVSYGSNGNYTGIVPTDGQPTVLGARLMDNGNTHLPFIGNINDLSIWSESLSGDQIQNIYANNYENENTLVGKWNFSEGEGQLLYDRTGNANHATINGPTWSEDVYVPPAPPVIGGNNSLSFDGVDDYISLNQLNRAGGNDLTINVYAKGQGTMTCPRTPGYESYFGYAVNDSRNQIFFHMGVLTSQSGFNWDVSEDYSNEYHFYSIVLDDLQNGSTLAKLYVDGVSMGQHIYPYSIQSYSEMEIGRNIVEQNGLYNGNISEIQFWNRALSAQEINYRMVISPEGNEEDLFGFWNFNEGQGSILTDLSSNGQNGNIHGATWSGDHPIVGCTDTYADNYDPEANINSRFCYGYPENGDHSLSFVSNQDHVDFGNNMDSDDKFSITTWVYIDENIIPLNGQRTFINKVNSDNGNKSIFLGSYQSKIGFTVLTGQQSNIMYGSDNQNGSLALTQTPLVSGWQHVGAVFTGDSMLVYINGILDQNVVVFDGPGSVNDYENSVWHMADVLGGSGNVGGKISEMNLWNTALKQNQIQQLMYESPDNLSAGLMGSWKFSEGDGDLLYDHSGNGNHGSILGATWNSDVPYIGPEWFVSTDGDDSNIGSLEQPFLTIQKAINSAGDGHLVSVSPGTYYENINYNGKNILIISEVGPDQTIINGGQNGSVVTFNTNETDGAAIDGFTITNGYTNENGGGIFIDGASPGIYNVIVENNYANSGGGIDLKGESNSIISNSIVRNNLAEWGAGIYFHSNSPTVENVVVSGNHATTNAGGVYARDNSFPVIINCTIVNNSTDGEGGGILTWFNSLVDVKNSIIRDNYPTEIGHVTGGAVNLNYSNISSNHQGFTGSNNINEDSKFCNQSNDNFRLAQDSPCIGTGEFGNDIGVMFDGEYCEQSVINESLIFDGQDDYVDLGTNSLIGPTESNSFTILLWVKPVALNNIIVSKYENANASNSNFYLGTTLDGIYSLSGDGTNGFNFGNVELNEWQHIALVFDYGLTYAYINGLLKNSQQLNLSAEISSQPLLIGAISNTQNKFNGSVDEVSVWSDVLSQEQIQAQMSQGFIGIEQGLLGYWNFNEGQGSTLTDLTGNDNNGTIYGASWNNYGAPIISSNDDNNEPDINANLTGIISNSIDGTNLEGAHIIAISEDNSFTAETFSDENGSYSLGLVGSLNYFVNISFDGLIDHDEYLFIGPFEDTYLNVSLDLLEDALVEGTVTDWYTNAPLASASVLLAYTDEEMITIESTTDENGYFMVQVPGEEDYDLFVYSDGYWVEHDAFYLSSGEHQVLNVGIAEMSAASRLYGTVRDFDTDELIPYAEIQLNCEQASDWDHTGELGTYRVFNYYPGDCDDGVLVVTANGYETSVQSVGYIEFEAGSSYDLDIALVQGNDPDPGMVSGTVYSNIDGNVVDGAEVVAYNVNTTQLFSIETSDDGYYQLFLPESEYYISINAPYHEELLDTLTIISGQSFTMDFNLDQVIEYKISGVVSDQNGNPLSGIETYVTRGNGYRTAYTNENGEYELFVPNGTYDVGSGSNNYFINLVSGVEVQDNDIVLDLFLESVQEFDGGFAGTVHLNDGDMTSVQINVWDNNSTYNAYVSSDENGAFALPLVNGTYTIYAWVPNSDYESIYIPNAFTVENNVVSYDLYFIAPDGPEAPTIVFLEDVPNDQGGQLELAWTPGEPREYEIFPQYSVWRLENEWNLIATVPYHGFDLYNMVVPTLGDSTSDGIFESTFMVTAHTLDQNTFFDSNPLTGYSIDNIFPSIPQQLMASVEGETVELNWDISSDEDFSYYNVYRQDQSSLEAASIFETENNYYSDNINIDGDYQYWVTAVDFSGNESDPSEPAMVTLGVQEDLMPIEYALMQNYPNPFNPSTQIMYSLPKTSLVKIIIYDMLGSKVRTLYSGVQDAGYKNVLWNATNETGDPVSAGMYIYTIEAESFFASKKMILLK